MVECNLAKVEVAGSNPVSRSTLSAKCLRRANTVPPHFTDLNLEKATFREDSACAPQTAVFSRASAAARTAGRSVTCRNNSCAFVILAMPVHWRCWIVRAASGDLRPHPRFSLPRQRRDQPRKLHRNAFRNRPRKPLHSLRAVLPARRRLLFLKRLTSLPLPCSRRPCAVSAARPVASLPSRSGATVWKLRRKSPFPTGRIS